MINKEIQNAQKWLKDIINSSIEAFKIIERFLVNIQFVNIYNYAWENDGKFIMQRSLKTEHL